MKAARIDEPDVDAGAACGLAIAADRRHRTAPLGAGQRVVHGHGEPDEQTEHPRDAAILVEIEGDRTRAPSVIDGARNADRQATARTSLPRGGERRCR